MCGFQERKFGCLFRDAVGTISRVVPDGVGGSSWGFGLCYVHDLAFGGVEGHLPGLFPVNESVQVMLEVGVVSRAIDFPV